MIRKEAAKRSSERRQKELLEQELIYSRDLNKSNKKIQTLQEELSKKEEVELQLVTKRSRLEAREKELETFQDFWMNLPGLEVMIELPCKRHMIT